jgi:tricorn protease
VVKVPLEPGNYRSLKSAKDKLFYLAMPPLAEYYTYYLGKLHEYDIDQGKDRVVLSQIYDYEVSKEGNKVLYAAPGTWGIVDAATPHQIGEGQLNLEGLEMRVDPKAEWQQMFNEAWRLERDFFYDPNMHGIDWNAMKEKYGQLLPYAAHREDLNYLIGEMIGELCCSHTYVGGGDMPGVEWASVGLMGADLEPGKEGYYQFKKIYEGENWNERRRAPLTEPGAQVKEGEYLISVEGKEVRYPDNPYKYFINSAGKQVRIEVGPRPTPKKTREIIIRPIASDNELRYLDWVKTNREKVEEATNGKVGYIHVPDTSISGLNEFSKAFFAQIDKEGLIIDVRFNSGGMIPEMFIEHLRRELISFFVPREGNVWRTPQVALHGPMVCIINEYAGSGGDAFPYYFHTYGLGPLIGKRTWGGLVGIAHGLIPLMDGGFVTCPEFAFMSLEGEWAVENHGVDPDIEVDNKPDSVIRGRDPQLEKAIEVILEEIEELEALPSRPPYPIKNESYQEKDFL